MLCAHCDHQILPGQPYTTDTVETGTGVTPDVHRHKNPEQCQVDVTTQPLRRPPAWRR
ncbi:MULTISPECIES: hypothetical protein [unclassified Streptomyces]|uniref:hypothetical protein n=1 Tax=unclassified Streptomyces TaxID=2593676 RepID=UPI003814854F